MKLDIPFSDELCEFTDIKKLEKTSLDLKIEQKYGTIIYKFKILHYNWETDNYGYVVIDSNGNKILVTTNHGRLMVVGVDYIKHKIKEYENVIECTEQAIKFFENGKH